MRKKLILAGLLMVLVVGGPLYPAGAAASLELYGTFHAMGVIVSLAPADDPDGDVVANLAYRTSGETVFQQGFPLSRIGDARLVGSLFWLEPGTSYDVRVTFSDPDGVLHNVTLNATASTRPEIVIPSPNHSFVVGPAGSGTACTLGSPCSLSEGLSQAQAGDEVVLRGGIYYQGEFDLPRSGSAGAPIVIRAYQGETAVLEGADPTTFSWTSIGDGTYQTTVKAPDTHLVMADGQRLFPYEDLNNLRNLGRDNTPGFMAEGTTLYVHLAGDADPNSADVDVSRYNYAFSVEQDHIYFLDLTFRYYGQGSYGKAIYFYNASDNLVQNCVFASNDLGVGIKWDSHRNVIQDSEFYDTIFNWPWDDIKDVGRLEDGGVRFYSPTDGRGNIIRRNTFHDDFDGFGACPGDTSVVTFETDVYENLVYDLGDDGVETDGRCSNVRIWGNTFHDVLVGISLAPVYDGPVYALRNLIYRTGVGNNSYTGIPFKFNSGYDQSGPMYLFHNTADAYYPGNDGFGIKSPGTWELITTRNNIWAGTEYALSNANPSQPLDLDYDNLYTTLSGELAWWSGLSDRHLNTLAELQAATGQELHGWNLEPGFVDPAAADYALADASELIDVGLLIPGINDNFLGLGPDLGAFEYEGYGFTLAAEPSAQSIAPGGTAVYQLSLQSLGGFSQTVNLAAGSPSPSLTLNLEPDGVIPPAVAALTVTDMHVAPLIPGLWVTFPITATSDGLSETVYVDLLVGGSRVHLPLVLRNN